MNTIKATSDTKDVTLVNDGVSGWEHSAAGRLYRDNNRVNWSVGAHNAIMRVDRIHPNVIAGYTANLQYDGKPLDKPVIATAFSISIDAMARVDKVSQRITKRLYTVGFAPSENGVQRPYLLTASGGLHTLTATGEKLENLKDAVGLVIKAIAKATDNDATHFKNAPLHRDNSVTFGPVTIDPVALS